MPSRPARPLRSVIEKQVIAFLALTSLLGVGILIYLKSRPPVPVKVERLPADKKPLAGAVTAARSPRTVNINTADVEELMELRGIGEVLAGRIVAYRSSHGLFVMKDDITRVEGIGPALYEKIKDRITAE